MHTTPSLRVTPLGAATPKVLATGGEPILVVSYASQYSLVYSDVGSGADQDVTLWRPQVPSGFYMIGDYAQGNYSEPSGSSIILQVINDDPDNPLLKAPVGWSKVWTDKGSGGDQDGSVWSAQAPAGYVAIGFVGQSGYDAPSIDNYRCVRRDLVTATTAGASIWSDEGSGADQDVTLWAINGVPNAFVGQANYQPFAGSVFMLKSAN